MGHSSINPWLPRSQNPKRKNNVTLGKYIRTIEFCYGKKSKYNLSYIIITKLEEFKNIGIRWYKYI